MYGEADHAGTGAAADAGARRAIALRHDMADMWHYARRAGVARELKVLHRPNVARSLAAAAVDWMLIGLATAFTIAWGWLAAPVSLLVIGNRQRALGNLLHDAAHWSFDANRRRSCLLADVLFCWPLWTSMAIYRDEHNRHHRFLGDPARDPDFIHDEKRLPRGWLSVWLDQVISAPMFSGAVLGHVDRMGPRSFMGVVFWWVAVLGAIALVAGGHAAVTFAALWVVARATAFHAITAFREISDHVGLAPGSVLGFCRNHAIAGPAGQLFHPHNNGYHLLHHLAPGIPFHALPRAHALLLRWPRYAHAEQCSAYFAGKRSAVRSWVWRWAALGPRSR